LPNHAFLESTGATSPFGRDKVFLFSLPAMAAMGDCAARSYGMALLD